MIDTITEIALKEQNKCDPLDLKSVSPDFLLEGKKSRSSTIIKPVTYTHPSLTRGLPSGCTEQRLKANIPT
jgi:hypothetical protein